MKGNFLNCCSPFYGNYSAYPDGYNPEFNYTQAQVESQINQQSTVANVCTSGTLLIKQSVADPTSAPPAEPLPVLSVQQHVDPVRGDHHPQPGDVPRGPRLLRAHQHLPGISCPGRNITILMVVVHSEIFQNEAESIHRCRLVLEILQSNKIPNI